MKLIMMGTGPFAVPTLRTLLSSPHEVLCLVTRPEKPVHGRKKVPPNPMRELAEGHGLPVFVPESINDPEGLALLEGQPVELLVVCDYGQILSATALGKAPLGGINLHGSLLPKYRGAAPIQWALLHGESQSGVSVIHMTPRLDGGPILVQRSVKVGWEEDAVTLEPRLAELGAEAVVEAIELLAAWDRRSPLGRVQSPQLVTKAPRLQKSHGRVDWSRSAQQIFNQVRALKPWPGTFTHLLREAKPPLRVILEDVAIGNIPPDPDVPVGSIQATDSGPMSVRCGQGVLQIQQLQPAGKRSMTSAEFWRGYGGEVMKFGNPPE